MFCLIFFFGRTLPPKNVTHTDAGQHQNNTNAINTESILGAARQKLSPSQQAQLAQLESAVVRGDVKDQQVQVYRQLAAFWKDSAHALLPFMHYTSEAAKLENSEKSLTFAAHFMLDEVRGQSNADIRKWMATEAKELFEKAIELNPASDSLKVGLGSCYLFGNISETPMQGITMIREVSERDPNNMYAQFMLGVGALISGQIDRAIERLTTVADRQPENPEVLVMLAEAHERKGNKELAIRWYQNAKKIIRNPEILQEIDQRISQLQK